MKGKAKAAEFAGEGYKVHVTGRNVLVTEAMKTYAIEKVSKIERFSDRIIDISVTMDTQKLEHRVDIIMKVEHIKIKGHASSTDMYVSIDRAVNRIERQLRRYKKRIQDHYTRPMKVVDLKVNILKNPNQIELEDVNYEIEDENTRRLVDDYKPHEIVSTETRPLKHLTQEEAIMKMELSQDAFLIYRAEEDLKLRAMYRREDGNFNVIEIEA